MWFIKKKKILAVLEQYVIHCFSLVNPSFSAWEISPWLQLSSFLLIVKGSRAVVGADDFGEAGETAGWVMGQAGFGLEEFWCLPTCVCLKRR